MGSTSGYIYKTTSGKGAIEQVPLEDVCILPKTELGHLLICLPNISLK